ncbi:MAG: signal transduction histidine kinase [Candidatus Binatia bacterium]|jgi:signal transduction histidine kinase
MRRLAAAIARGDGPRELAALAVQALAETDTTTWAAVVYDIGDGAVVARTAAAPGDCTLTSTISIASDASGLAAAARDAGASVVRRLGGKAHAPGVLLWAGDCTGDRTGDRADDCADDAIASRADLVAALLGPTLEARRLVAENEHLRELAVRSERLASVGGMTAGLAHEIRNPLVSIRTFTQLLPERYDDPEFRSSFLDLTLSEVDRICNLVGELLAYARPPADSDLQTTDVSSCVDRTVLLMGTQARTSGVTLSCDHEGGAGQPAIAGDRLQQVLLNLVNNGLAACNNGGAIRIRTAMADGDVVIEVSDDGVGMTPEVVKRAFETFYTTRDDGTGLGLAIVRRLVKQAGGTVDLKTSVGAGTTVSIVLPVSSAGMDVQQMVVHG